MPHAEQRAVAERERQRAADRVDREVLQPAAVRPADADLEGLTFHLDAERAHGDGPRICAGQADVGRPRRIDERAVERNRRRLGGGAEHAHPQSRSTHGRCGHLQIRESPLHHGAKQQARAG